MAVSQEWSVRLARNESDMSWSNVGPTRWPWPLTCLWPWPWIFKVKFSNCFISGRGCLPGMKWRGYEFNWYDVADIISKLTADGLLWRHRHMGQPLTIVTSQWPIVSTGIYGRMMLRSARVEGIAITCLFTLLIIFGLPCFNTGHR